MDQSQKRRKGYAIEKKICSLLSEALLTASVEFFDIAFGDTKIEVKSAELKISNGSKKSTRQGRFIIDKENHEKLIAVNGWYAFVLTFKTKPILIRFARAKNTKPVITNHFSFISLTALYSSMTIREFKEVVLWKFPPSQKDCSNTE